LKRQKKKGGKLLVDLVKLTKIAISPVLGKGLAADEGHSNQQKYRHFSVRGRVELRMLFRVAKEILMKFAKSIALVALAMFVPSFAQQVQTDFDHRSAQVAPAAEHGSGETVTPNFEHAIPNIPGKSLVARVVDYAPGGGSPSHKHAESACIYAYVVAGAIESQVNDGPKRVYRAGDSWFEGPGSFHRVSRNASKTQPAKLLAVFVVDTNDKALTTPVE
jgi:quercetin dioxygenase-like cupin family protein